MRVAALYDIHGNLPALEAVLDEVREAAVDLVVVGGDVVPGPMPRETIARILDLDLPVRFIRGNGDREVLARMRGAGTETLPPPALEAIRWVAEQLGPEEERLLASWPPTCRVDVRGVGEVLFCHGTPTSDTEIFTRLTPEDRLRPLFDGLAVSLVVCGHTHMQFDRAVGRTRVVNAGSIGMPFGAPGAYWLLLAPEVELRRSSYDLASAAERIVDTTYPQARDFAERNVVQPPTEHAMLEALGRAELGRQPAK